MTRPWARLVGWPLLTAIETAGDGAEGLEWFGISFDGRPHDSLDDARNIAKILMAVYARATI